MNTLKKIIGSIALFLPLLSVAQDYDDVYFTKADRVEIAAERAEESRAVARSRANERPSEKFANPEYEAGSGYVPTYDYFREEEFARLQNSRQMWQNRFNPMMNPMMMGGFSPMMGMGFGTGFYDPFWDMRFNRFNRWNRFGWGGAMGFGWNRFGGGFYDPFWNPGMGMGFGWSRWGRPAFANPYYCPPVVVVGGDNPNRVFRTRMNAPRSNRSRNTRNVDSRSRYNRSNSDIDGNGRRAEPTRRSRNGSWNRSRNNKKDKPSYTPRRGNNRRSGGNDRPSYTPRRSGGSSGGGSRRSGGGSRRRGGGE